MNGLFVGKFLPPHQGHKWAILDASKKCDVLFVVVGENPDACKRLCKEAKIPYIDLSTKTAWLKEEFSKYQNIKIIPFDESGISSMPFGWKEWSEKLKILVKEKIDVIFGSEESYAPFYKQYFPESEYVLQDPKRSKINISATKIRANINSNLDYIISSAKKFFKEQRK